MTKLPQLKNSVEIVGTLKSLELENLTSKTGKPYVKGTVTVAAKSEDKIHEHKISVFQMATSKLYKGIQTMMREYRSSDLHPELADRIRVTGEVELEQYMGKDGNIRSFNKIKGVFFNRLEADDVQPDKAMAAVEVIVKSFTPAVDKETGEITHSTVKCFTVGYNESVVELKKAIVKTALADSFEALYPANTTGMLNFKLNNYVVKTEKPKEEKIETVEVGFGAIEAVAEAQVFDKFVSEYEITGGLLPFEEPKAYTAKQIQAAERKMALAIEELKQGTQAPSTPPVGNAKGAVGGFGDLGSGMPIGMMNMPPILPATSAVPIVPSTTVAPPLVSTDDVPDF